MNSSSNSCSDKKPFSESFKDLVKQCLEHDPGNRPTLERLHKHGFFSRCKPPCSLAKNMVHELFSLEYRFTLSKEKMGKFNIVGGEEEEQDEKTRECRVSGWKLNVESLELSPILQKVPLIDLTETREHDRFGDAMITEDTLIDLRETTRQVRFGGEIIIEEKEVITEEEEEEEEEEEDDDLNEETENSDELLWEQFEEVSVELGDVSVRMDELNLKTPRDEILETLYYARINLKQQLGRVEKLIISHGGELPEKEEVKVSPSPTPTPEIQMDGQLFRELLERNIKLNSVVGWELDKTNRLLSQ